MTRKHAKYKVSRLADRRKTEERAIRREERADPWGDARYTSDNPPEKPVVKRSDKTILRKRRESYFTPQFAHERTSLDEETLNVPEHKLKPGRVPASTYSYMGDTFMSAIMGAIEAQEQDAQEIALLADIHDVAGAPSGNLGVAHIAGQVLNGGISQKDEDPRVRPSEADVWADTRPQRTEGLKTVVEGYGFRLNN